MVNYETTVGSTLNIPFVEENRDTGVALNTFSLILLRDGVIYTNLLTPPVYAEIGNGLYTAQMQFTETGTYTAYLDNSIAASIVVKERSIDSYLSNIEDASMGSWSWNKETGILTLYRVSGSVLSTYNMSDTDTLSSREKL